MIVNRRNSSSRNRNAQRACLAAVVDSLEMRQMLAAHILGSASVYGTIQAAVDAAAPGATITVDAGTYAEQVVIYKKLTLLGAGAGIDARGNSRVADNGVGESVCTGVTASDGTITYAFKIAADDVTLDGFTVQGETNKSVTTGAGIVIAPKISGAHILNNIVQNNVSGLFLANFSTTNPAVIQHNVFRNNNNPGVNGGRGIYTDQVISGGNITNVTIDANAFVNNRGSSGTTSLEAAIAFEAGVAGAQSDIRVTNNVMDSNGKAVLFFYTDSVLVSGNFVTRTLDWYSGSLRFEGGDTNVTIVNNTCYANTGPAVAVDAKGVPASDSGFVVTNNNIYGNSTTAGQQVGVVYNQTSYDGVFDARNNYWGNPSGPSGDGPGSGDAVYGNAHVVPGSHWSVATGGSELYSPWSTTPVGPMEASYWGAPANDGAPIQAENFNHGGEGVAYHDLDSSNSGGQYRATGVDIENTSDTGGGWDVTSAKAGEWMDYAVNFAAAGTYDLDVRLASSAAGGTFHFELDGSNLTGAINVPSTGGAQKWTTITKPGLILPAGPHTLRLVVESNSSAAFNYFKFTNTVTGVAPIAPGPLAASPVSPSQINLTWADNSTNETGFVIERKTGASGAWQSLATVAANIATYSDATVAGATSYIYRVRATNGAGDSPNSNEATATTPAAPALAYVSDLPWVSSVNGWGPAERDTSNAGDTVGGNTITINGVTYAKGLGVHAYSEIVLDIKGAYDTFASDIGVDDETGPGTVTFQVWGDGVMLYDSGLVTQADAAKSISVPVTGVQQLKLIVTNGGDDNDCDHADWAAARLTGPAPITPVVTIPNAPSGLTATAGSASINLSWSDGSTNEDGFRIERSTGSGAFSQIASVAANTTSYADSTALAGQTYTYRVIAYNSAGASAASNTASATVALPAPTLPAPWKQTGIGSPALAGSASATGGVFSVSGAGTGIGSTSDSAQFVYQTLSGNGTIIARVTGVQNTGASAMSGLMIRQSLSANSAQATLGLTPSGGLSFIRRLSTGAAARTTKVAGPVAPYWLKLVRSGNTFSAYRSTNGTTWTLIGSQTITMTGTVYIGMVVTSQNAAALNKSTFDNVSIA